MVEKEVSLTSIEMDLNEVMNDLKGRVYHVLEKYSDGGLFKIPNYRQIKNPETYYKTCNMLLESSDEIVMLMMRVSLVSSQLEDIRSTKLNRSLTNDISLLTKFNRSVGENIDVLRGFRYDLLELRRQLSDKLRVIQGLSYLEN